MRKIILNMAMSLDGYIADASGGFDWIKGQGESTLNTTRQFDFEKFKASVDTIVMGSKAYEDCVLSGLDTYDDKQLVVASSRIFEPKENVQFVNEEICSKILDIRQEDGKDIWIFGGGKLADAFIKEDIIDQYIIGIVPVILGKGRPLFSQTHPMIELTLSDSTISDGITILHYSRR